MVLVQALLGLAVLFFGRQLFWLFVGAVGFMLAVALLRPFLLGRPEWQVVLVGLGAGVLGAFCALALERAAVTVAGLLVGGAVAVRILYVTGLHTGVVVWLGILAGCVLGAVVVVTLFDWALIVFSSAVGAALLANGISAYAMDPGPLVFALLAVGILVQGSQFIRRGGERS